MKEMTKTITVSIAYMDFSFETVAKAVAFADTAASAIKDADRNVSIKVTYKEAE